MSHKPLGRKAYGSIGHLPSSRLGPKDKSVHEGQARICTEKARDKHDRIIVQEKLDGSCCSVAKVDGRVWALGRAGYPASTSPYAQHQYFDVWVRERYALFDALLSDGQRFVGEWMAQAHGTMYDTDHPAWSPFIVFDLMGGHERAPYDDLLDSLNGEVPTPYVISDGPPLPTSEVADRESAHGADKPEGAVYRVERRGNVDFLAKWVDPEKVDGIYLPSTSVAVVDSEVWHWTPGPTP